MHGRSCAAIAATVVLLASQAAADPTEGTDGSGTFGEWSGNTSVDNATGAFRHAIPIRAPASRGKASLSLALTYDSSSGDREAGYGWGLNLPVIERRAMTGFPVYDNTKDRFTFSGQPLVYICTVGSCPPGEEMPPWATTNTRYYRLQNEGRFARFFLMYNNGGDQGDWRVQERDGTVLHFGKPHIWWTGAPRAVDRDAEDALPDRWHLTLIEDLSHNKVYLKWAPWASDLPERRKYLTDIFDTPSSNTDGPPVESNFAHHIQLTWEDTPRPVVTYVHADRAPLKKRLKRIAVSSHTWTGSSGEREVLRLYKLSYLMPALDPLDTGSAAPLSGHSFLSRVDIEGRCASNLESGGQVPGGMSCANKLPGQAFEYQPATRNALWPPRRSIPPHALPRLMESMVVVDADRDGLPDVIRASQQRLFGVPTAVTPSLTEQVAVLSPFLYPTMRNNWLYRNHGHTGSAGVDPFALEPERCIDTGPYIGDPMGLSMLSRQGAGKHYTGPPLALMRPPSFLSPTSGTTVIGNWGHGSFLWTIPELQGVPPGGETLPGAAASVFLERTTVETYVPAAAGDPDPLQFCPGHPSGEAAFRWEARTGGPSGAPDGWKRDGWVLLPRPIDLTAGTEVEDPQLRVGRVFVDIDGDGYPDMLHGQPPGGPGAIALGEVPDGKFFPRHAWDLQSGSIKFTRKTTGAPPWAGSDVAPDVRLLRPFADSTSPDPPSPLPAPPPREPCASAEDAEGTCAYGYTCEIPYPPFGTPCGGLNQCKRCRSLSRHHYVDMNGDGLVDLVRQNPASDPLGSVLVYPGDGRGRFGVVDADPAFAMTAVPYAPRQTVPTTGPLTWASTEQTFFHDVNGDGLADFIAVDTGHESLGPTTGTGTVKVWINLDGMNFACANIWSSCVVTTILDGAAGPPPYSRITFADMDANGVDDLVVLSSEAVWIYNLVERTTVDSTDARAPRPGLLRRIRTDNGAVTEVKMMTIPELDSVAAAESAPTWTGDPGEAPAIGWKTHVPVAPPVVTSVRTRRELPAGGGNHFDYSRQTTYSYRNPAYDPWERRFLGFRRSRVVEWSGSQTDYTRRFGACAKSTFTSEFMLDCSNTSDDAQETGELVQVDVHAPGAGMPGQPVGWLSSTHYDVEERVLYAGSNADPRRVVFRPVVQTTTRQFDPALWVELHSTGDAYTGMPLLPTQNAAATTRSAADYDSLGRPMWRTALGRVADSGECLDPQLRTTFVYGGCTPDGLCNQLAQVIQDGFEPGICGATPSGPQRRTLLVYEDPSHFDLPTAVVAHVEGTLALDRHHEVAGEAIAPLPAGQSPLNADVTVSRITYDGFGNVVRVEGAGAPSTCTDIIYDGWFATFPVHTKAYKGGCGSGDYLDTFMLWDRGMDVAAMSVAVNGGLTSATLDHAGRPLDITFPPADGPPSLPLVGESYAYQDFGDIPYVQHTVKASPNLNFREFTFMNGIGEPAVHVHTGDGSTGREWIVDQAVKRDDMGAVEASEWPGFTSQNPPDISTSGALTPYPIVGPRSYVSRDGFHRAFSVWQISPSLVVKELAHHTYAPLEVRSMDAHQLSVTGKEITTRYDGHGRVRQVLAPLGADVVTTTSEYWPTGEPRRIRRTHASVATDVYERTMTYDSLGRLVRNVEPNVGEYRYAWDDGGKLLGLSDARGCGKNIFYDAIGRVIGEDFSPCKAYHAPYSPPTLSGDGVELVNLYDNYEPGQEAPPATSADDFHDSPDLATGQLVATYDRGGHTRVNRDIRGNVRRVTRRAVKPPPPAADRWAPSPIVADRYAAHAFLRRAKYDWVGRATEAETGSDSPALWGDDGTSRVMTAYTDRGTVANIHTSYVVGPRGAGQDHSLLDGQVVAADGRPEVMNLGDLATTQAKFLYSDTRNLREYIVDRPTQPLWSTSSPTYPSPTGAGTTQEVLTDLDMSWYNAVDLPLTIRDASPSAWPPGSEPPTRDITYDDMYHVTSVASWYSGGSQVSPFAAEIASGSRRPVPLKDVATRVRTQQFVYDFLGNTEYTVDDLGLRYDRSLGNITNAGDSTSKKNQLVAADGIAAKYDEAGNLVDLRVERPGTRCDPDLCAQRFVYEWDEVGQLSRARRWDYFQTIPATEPEYPAVPTSAPAADLHFAYHLGQRILKTREVAGEDQLHTVEVYDSLRLNDTTYDTETNDYGRDPPQATVYLAGMGRVVRDPYLPTSTGNMTHVFLNVGDHLGSVGMVIDGETSELVEKTTHQPYGALESDYRPTRWRSFREDYKFTGKEEDIEVGIQYFGARYYAPRLGRWMSADPLTIHGLGADLNPYAYVGGRVLSSRDPWGLTEEAEPQPQPQPPQAWGACELCPTEEVTVHGDRYERYIREESYARIDATRPGGADVVTPVLLGIGQAYLNFSNGVAEKLYGLDKYRTALESWRNGRARANPRAVPAAIIRGTPLLPNTVADKIDPHDKDDVLGPAVEHVYGNAQDAIAIFGLAGPMAIGGVARAGALAGEIGAAGGGGGRTVALGLSGPRGTWLARFAERVGGTTWKEWGGANWRQGFMEVMADPGTKAHFNLTGISPSPLGAAARGATPLGGATEWELSMIRNNSQWWSRITWWAEGKPVANPFGP